MEALGIGHRRVFNSTFKRSIGKVASPATESEIQRGADATFNFSQS